MFGGFENAPMGNGTISEPFPPLHFQTRLNAIPNHVLDIVLKKHAWSGDDVLAHVASVGKHLFGF